jgi:predicted O-linked N-acetylglucosamine transferase (SPINDLY family)
MDELARARALMQSGQVAQAIEVAQRAVRKNSNDVRASTTLGILLIEAGRHDQGLFHLRRAATGGQGEALHNLGLALARMNQEQEAAAVFERAVAAQHTPSIANLMMAYSGLRRYDDAARLGRDWMARRPDLPKVRAATARTLLQQGLADQAVAILREGLRAAPADVDLNQTLVVTQEYAGTVTPQERLAAAVALARVISPPQPGIILNAPDPERAIRVVFLSPDFRDHSVAYFFESVLAAKDERVRYACCSLSPVADAVTARIKAAADEWIDAAGMPDPALAARLHSGGTDILVDLAGFTAGGRPGLISRRIAPVQVSYLGWAATTGLPTMDRRIVDSQTDPPGAESLATERLMRLDPCFLCYRPPEAAPPVAPREGPIHFGSFNALAKVSPAAIEAWSSILAAVPGSRLVLKAAALSDPATVALTRAAFERRGVEASRLEVLPWAGGIREHLEQYHGIDISLDTFPYNGTTTTCESLWMGVPVVTLAGASHAGRVGASLLGAAGMRDLIAGDAGEYERIAVSLASDHDRLTALRAGLRDKLRTSPLCDASAFARRFGAALRDLWRARCASAV